MSASRVLFMAALAVMVGTGTAADEAVSRRDKAFAAKPGGSVRIESAMHDVKVTITPGSSVSVRVDTKISAWPGDPKEGLKELEPVFSEEGGRIVVRCKPKRALSFGMRSVDGTISVTMPPGMAISLESGSGDCDIRGDSGGMPVSCTTGSGDFLLEGACRSLAAETGSGNVRARLSGPVESVRLRTGSGDVDFAGGAKEFSAEAGSGNLVAEGLTGRARFRTGSGDVTARWGTSPPGNSIAVSTGSGDVALRLPAGASLSGTLHSRSGTIRSDFQGAMSRRGTTCTLSGGSGSGALDVDTGSGDISLFAGR